jgi:hypothetical protein
MLFAKIKNSTLAAIAALFLLTSSTAVILYTASTPPAPKVIATPVTLPDTKPIEPPPPPAGWRDRLDAVYKLEEGQTLKLVSPPFIPERQYVFQGHGPGFDRPPKNGIVVFQWQGTTALNRWTISKPTIAEIMRMVLKVPSYRYQMDDGDKLRQLPGDWVLRPGATTEELMADLSKILRQRTGWDVTFDKQRVERELFIARGTYSTDNIPLEKRMLELYLDQKKNHVSHNGGTLNEFLIFVGELMNHEIVDETTTPKSGIYWKTFIGANISDKYADRLLDNISDQIPITFSRERRLTTLWTTHINPPAASAK